MNLAIFDFDGTLSAGDASRDFFFYALARSPRPWLFLPLTLAGAVIRRIFPNTVPGRQFMRRWLSPQLLRRLKPGFVRRHKLKRFGWARDQVIKEKKSGASVILISASPDYLLHDLAADMPFDKIICSRMDPRRPWRYKSLCYGAGKAAAMPRGHVIRAYSDNKSDMPVMRLADEQIWIDPRTGLRRAA